MIVRTTTTALALFTLCIASTLSMAQDVQPSFETTSVGDNLYMISGATGFTGGNIGLLAGDEAVVVIDNGVAGVLDLLRAEIAKVTKKPVDYLINTHVHGDHTGNNAAFGSDGTSIISHDNLRMAMLRDDKAAASALPSMTFSDQMTLNINGDSAKILHLSNAHTDGDAVIYFQNANVIHAGDIFFNTMFPYIDTSNGGSLDGMINALQEIAGIGNADSKIIPGHGPLASKQDIASTIAMLEDTKQVVAKMVTAGKSEAEILAAEPLAKYSSFAWNFITAERMTKQLIAAAK